MGVRASVDATDICHGMEFPRDAITEMGVVPLAAATLSP